MRITPLAGGALNTNVYTRREIDIGRVES